MSSAASDDDDDDDASTVLKEEAAQPAAAYFTVHVFPRDRRIRINGRKADEVWEIPVDDIVQIERVTSTGVFIHRHSACCATEIFCRTAFEANKLDEALNRAVALVKQTGKPVEMVVHG
jgi:hypothetical protein